MVVWMLQNNPSIRFYEKSGALPVSSKEIEIGGARLSKLAFAWPDLGMIVASL
jgi:hypothetical protein